MKQTRSSGVLLHPTSLPGGMGVGDLGEEAYRFVDWLVAARQSLWQVLPLGPTGYGDSPYASFSSHAGNPMLIDLRALVELGDLDAEDLADLPGFPTDHVARFLAIATELVQKGKMDPLSELQKTFNENIKLLTNNGYARATFSQGGVIKFFKADSLLRVSMDSMSPATRDSMYFALKFALIESMLNHISLPIVLDDPFVMFDDERLAAAVTIIKRLSQRTQVVLLTSRQGALQGADRSLKIK